MNKKIVAVSAALSLMLGACSKSKDDGKLSDDGFEMSIDLGDGENSEADKIKIGGDGEDSKFSIKADGFSMDVDLPAIALDSDDFEFKNLSLYPGTKVTSFNVEDRKGDGGKVKVGFVSPAGVDKLTQWFEAKMTEEKFKFSIKGTDLSGTSKDGDMFAVKLSEKSANETTGTLELSEQ